MPRSLTAALAALALTAPGTAAAATAQDPPLPQGGEPVTLDPADFTTRIDNPYWPMAAGTRWVYRETDGRGNRQKVVVRVTRRTRMVDGIRARVVRDTVTERGRLVEDTFDWYAQDRAGNVWYLGEATREYEDGRFVGNDGSFEAGVDGAQAGIAMPANPVPGLRYRQEYKRGEAEDRARVLSVTEQAQVPFGRFPRRVLLTKDVNPLEPRVLEYKLYARGVGPVLVLDVSGGTGREELLSFRRPASSPARPARAAAGR